MITKNKALLGFELYEISSIFIYNLRQSHPNPKRVFSLLPEFTLNGAGNIKITEYYHQFTGFEDKEDNKFLFFNLYTLDKNLQEEISNAGYENFFPKGLNFGELFSLFKPNEEECITKLMFPKMGYFIVELTYRSSYGDGGYDYELDVGIYGYLKDDFNVILL